MGDILLTEALTGTKITTHEAFENLFGKLVETEAETARFNIRRGDQTAVAELPLARGN